MMENDLGERWTMQNQVSTHEFASKLQVALKKRHLSLSRIATEARVAKSTISRWLNGSCLPDVKTLDAVLGALKVSYQERVEWYGCIEKPRTDKATHLETIAHHDYAADDGIHAPSLGTLLRSFRLRKGWKLSDAAENLRTSIPSISLWENGQRKPDREIRNRMALAYGLDEHEGAILKSGLRPPPDDTYDKLVFDIDEYVNELTIAGFRPFDATFVLFQSRAWNLMRQDQSAISAFALATAWFSDALALSGRTKQAKEMAINALNMLDYFKEEEWALVLSYENLAHVDYARNPARFAFRSATMLSELERTVKLARSKFSLNYYMCRYYFEAGAAQLSREAGERAQALADTFGDAERNGRLSTLKARIAMRNLELKKAEALIHAETRGVVHECEAAFVASEFYRCAGDNQSAISMKSKFENLSARNGFRLVFNEVFAQAA